MNVPDDLLYTKDHEWIRIADDIATIGVTDFAQGELGDIIFIEFPNKGIKYQSGDPIGTIEAVKTVADLFIPVSGEIIDVNEELESTPELINSAPYREGWIVKIKLSNYNDSLELLDSEQYKDLLK